jgi:hypothetical protein
MPTALGLPYPAPTDHVSAGANDIRALAEAVDPLLSSELAYASFTGAVTCPGGTTTGIVTAPVVTLPVGIELLIVFAGITIIAGAPTTLHVYDGAVSVSVVGHSALNTQASLGLLAARVTASAAAHTYSIRAAVAAGGNAIVGMAGGSGFIRVQRAG